MAAQHCLLYTPGFPTKIKKNPKNININNSSNNYYPNNDNNKNETSDSLTAATLIRQQWNKYKFKKTQWHKQ